MVCLYAPRWLTGLVACTKTEELQVGFLVYACTFVWLTCHVSGRVRAIGLGSELVYSYNVHGEGGKEYVYYPCVVWQSLCWWGVYHHHNVPLSR